MRQSASNAMDFGQTHGLHGNMDKLYYAAVTQGHQALLTGIQKVSENIRASVQFPGTSCPTSISGERHAVRFRALPCDSPRRPRKKGGEGGDSNACNKFGPPPSPPFHAVIQKWGKWIFCRGGRPPRKKGHGCPSPVRAGEGALFFPLLPLPMHRLGFCRIFRECPIVQRSATVRSGHHRPTGSPQTPHRRSLWATSVRNFRPAIGP